MRNPVDSDYYQETLHYCRGAMNDVAQLKDYKRLRKADHFLAILMALKPAGVSGFRFLNEILPVSTLNPIIADAEMAFVRRSEEHTSELQSLMRNSYAFLCLIQTK